MNEQRMNERISVGAFYAQVILWRFLCAIQLVQQVPVLTPYTHTQYATSHVYIYHVHSYYHIVCECVCIHYSSSDRFLALSHITVEYEVLLRRNEQLELLR